MSNDTRAIVPSGNGAGSSIQREGFGERSLERRHETSATAMAAAMQAEIQARYIVAMQRPRDEEQVRIRLLRDCARPEFALASWYQIPRKGAKGKLTGSQNVVEGLTVRFAERAIQVSGNILQTTRIAYDDDFKRMLTVAATDLETNAVYSRDIIIEKTVEKRQPKDGDVILAKRINSEGIEVSIVQATEAEIYVKEGNLGSRVFRNEALRFVDPGTLAECTRLVVATTLDKDAKDPDGARKAIADTFATVNVLPADLKAYLGHELAQCSPAELSSLRALFSAIRDGLVTWAEALAEKQGDGTPDGNGGGKKTVAEKLAEREAAKKNAAPKDTAKADPAKDAAKPATDQKAPASDPKPAAATASSTATPSPTGAPSAAAPVAEKSPTTCVVCKRPISFTDPVVKSHGGWRHEGCNAITGEIGGKGERVPGQEG